MCSQGYSCAGSGARHQMGTTDGLNFIWDRFTVLFLCIRWAESLKAGKSSVPLVSSQPVSQMWHASHITHARTSVQDRHAANMSETCKKRQASSEARRLFFLLMWSGDRLEGQRSNVYCSLLTVNAFQASVSLFIPDLWLNTHTYSTVHDLLSVTSFPQAVPFNKTSWVTVVKDYGKMWKKNLFLVYQQGSCFFRHTNTLALAGII